MEPKRYKNTDYIIYPDGQVYSEKSQRFLKPSLCHNGYLKVGLHYDGKRKQFRVHRLVAECFIPNPDNLQQVNHIDENKQNNHYSNLEWCSNKYNSNYGTGAQRSGLKRGKSVEMIDPNTGNVIQSFVSMAEAERQTGISADGISAVCVGRNKTAGGYLWRKCEAVDSTK